ncbi:MAG: hypothetical protein J2P54_01410 [Bradyrhizobiaceae bacterium]|nr:hypothetical protein [Bradyrhizobiaceae bacterium]
MHFLAKRVFAIIVMAIPLASYNAGAQTNNPTNSHTSDGTTQLTMEERLGEKWNDGQRVAEGVCEAMGCVLLRRERA